MHRNRTTAVSRRTRATAAGAALLLACAGLAACSSAEAPVVAPVAAVAAASVPAPTDVRVALQGTSAVVSWAPSGLPDLTGYAVYVDDAAAVAMPKDRTQHRIAKVTPGASHLVQVVAVAGQEQSLPTAVTVDVPAPRPSAVEVVEEPAVAAPVAQAPAPVQAPGAPAAAPAAPVASGYTVQGQLTATISVPNDLGDGPPEPNCTGFRPLLQLLDGAKAVVALAELSGDRVSSVEVKHGSTWWQCDWTYRAQVEDAPVYTFHAEYENSDYDRSDDKTVSRAVVASGKGPAMYISLCFGCSPRR